MRHSDAPHRRMRSTESSKKLRDPESDLVAPQRFASPIDHSVVEGQRIVAREEGGSFFRT